MATNDVPGYNPTNSDTLHDRCWAESSEQNDESLIYVMSVENGKVVFIVYDLKPGAPALHFMDSMHEADFKKFFSWDPKSGKQTKWTWHDKTPFPVDRIMRYEQPHGQSPAFASDHMSAAQRVADRLQKRFADVDFDAIRHRAPRTSDGGGFQDFLGKIGRALDKYIGDDR